MTGASAGATCPLSPEHWGEAGCTDVGGLGSPACPLRIWSGLLGLEGGTGGVAVSGLASHHGLSVVPREAGSSEKGGKCQSLRSLAELLPPRRKKSEKRPAGGRRSPQLGPRHDHLPTPQALWGERATPCPTEGKGFLPRPRHDRQRLCHRLVFLRPPTSLVRSEGSRLAPEGQTPHTLVLMSNAGDGHALSLWGLDTVAQRGSLPALLPCPGNVSCAASCQRL